MRESLLTIPINEVFEPKCGCPLCQLRNTVESHLVEYILGAAMMEPDVRIETNQKGFCAMHFDMLLEQKNRLPLALILDTHLAEMQKSIVEKPNLLTAIIKKPDKNDSKSDKSTCFICEKVNWAIEHTLKTFFVMYEQELSFRKLFSEQEYICLPHYRLLQARAELFPKKAKSKAEFLKSLDKLVIDRLQSLNEDVHAFCGSFDYRNAGNLQKPEMANARSSVLRSIAFLTGRNYEED